MRKIMLITAAAALLAAASLAACDEPAYAAARSCTEAGSYEMNGPDTRIVVSVTENTCDDWLRAYLRCTSDGGSLSYRYGGWVNNESGSQQTTANYPSCTPDGPQAPTGAGFEYSKTGQHRVQCWSAFNGSGQTGTCKS